MLGFPTTLVAEHGLRRGSPLLTVNTYMRGLRTARDLVPGPENLKQYTNFYPLIADFLSDDLQRFPGRHRNGLPWHGRQPAK